MLQLNKLIILKIGVGMIKFVGFGPEIELILRRLVDKVNIDLKGRDVEIVSAELTSNRSKELGLDYAMAKANDPNTAILLCTMMGDNIANNGRFQAAIGYPNVAYCDMLKIVDNLESKIAEAIEGKRPKDELAIRLATHEMDQSLLARLKHDMPHVVKDGASPEKKTEWIENARLLFSLPPATTFEEMVEKVNTTEKTGPESEFKGLSLPGVFVDVEGTLLVKDEGGNEVVNMPLVEKLQERAKTSPITIWTDTKIDYIKGPLRNAGILWKIVPKEYFKGCIPEEVVDDLSQEEFEAKYEIKPKKFTSPSDFISGEEKPLVEAATPTEIPVATEVVPPVADEAAPAQIPSAPSTSV
jgi:hypothetical protein